MGKVGLAMEALHKPAFEILEIRVQLNIALAYIHLGLCNFRIYYNEYDT